MTTKKKIKIIGVAVLAVLVIIWILQNGGPVQTKFLFISVTMPQSVLLVFTVLMGVVAGIFMTLAWNGKGSGVEAR